MKELIRKKISKIKDKEQRQNLKKINGSILEMMVDYQKEKIEELEEKIFNETGEKNLAYTVYNTIVNKEELIEIEDKFFPIDISKVDRTNYDISEIVEKIKKGRKMKIDHIYLDISFSRVKKIMDESKKYDGKLRSGEKEYDIKVTLKRSEDYILKEKMLYKNFLKNSIRWTTINNPYIRKFFDVYIEKGDSNLKELESIDEINYDLEKLEKVKYQDMIPVWNIEWITKKCSGFPEPAIDKINYKHILNFNETENNDGHIVATSNGQITDIYHKADGIIVTTPMGNSISWNLLRFKQNNITDIKTNFSVCSNKKTNTFINKMSHSLNRTPRTKGEIARIINSFVEITEFTLEEVELSKEDPEQDITYELNVYIEDEIHIQRSKDYLILKFQSDNIENNNFDVLSFLVSEIQLYFPEYECKGVLV